MHDRMSGLRPRAGPHECVSMHWHVSMWLCADESFGNVGARFLLIHEAVTRS